MLRPAWGCKMCRDCTKFTYVRDEHGRLDWKCSKDNSFKSGLEHCTDFVYDKQCTLCVHAKVDSYEEPCVGCIVDGEKLCYVAK